MLETWHGVLIAVFVLGYLAIVFEFSIKISKTAVALMLAVICWLVFFLSGERSLGDSTKYLYDKLSDVSQILFFLMGAMTLVEVVDMHKGFATVTKLLRTRSKRKMLIIISFVAFFLSSVLDNLTTTILMISILRKLIPNKKERFYLLCMIVIAANAGGAWTPIGDVTTTMLWINGQISSLVVMKQLFVPSILCVLVPLGCYWFIMRGKFEQIEQKEKETEDAPYAKTIFYIGVLGLIFVPVFKWLTGMPPFMGMLIALAVLWIVTDILHHKYENRSHLRVHSILSRIDLPSILFFLGILLSVDALEAASLLEKAARWLDVKVHSQAMIATLIGLLSAVIDNVPLVAATMGMYDITQFPIDSSLWMMIAYAAGTGGSILIIGSASGVALMGLENIDFFSYLKKASIPALAGYLVGMLAYVVF